VVVVVVVLVAVFAAVLHFLLAFFCWDISSSRVGVQGMPVLLYSTITMVGINVTPLSQHPSLQVRAPRVVVVVLCPVKLLL
jgi:hypothetical protein